MSQIQKKELSELSALPTNELVPVAQGPFRHDFMGLSQPDLSDALVAIDLLAERALSDEESTVALYSFI